MQIHPPVPSSAQASHDPSLSQLPPPERQRFSRILLVEDDADQLETLADLLAHEGYDVVGCTTGAEAMHCACEQPFGVVILDLQLPDIDGTRVLEQLHQLDGRARVIIHTGYGTFHAARAAINCGAFAFVEKLGEPEELLRQVRRAVTEQVSLYAADLERKRQEEQQRQAQKMEAIGRLAGGIAHDFNNLLTVIGGYSELLLARAQDHSTDRAMAEQIHHAVARGAALTRQLLAFSRQQPVVPQVLDLNEVVRSARGLLERLVGTGIELVTELVIGLPPIRADVNQLEQVLLNLALNARDALPDGGKLTIRTLRTPDGNVGLEVQDTGIGMDDRVRARLFEPFFTTKPQGKGTGLGLATVYGIVQRFQGRIEVNSAPGSGTTFQICFPPSEPRPAAPEQAPRPAEPPTQRETILLVEDEAPLRELLLRYLQSESYQVFPAAGGHEALEMMQLHGPQVQLLVTDLTMPRMGGKELAAKVRARFPDLKVLYISGYSAAPPGLHEALQPGEGFLQKPFPLPSLVRAMRALLDAVPA